MLQQLKLDLSLKKTSFLMLFFFILGGFAFGAILHFLIMTFDSNPGSWFCFGTLMSICTTATFLFFYHSFSYKVDFMLALSMGRTRSCFILSRFCILFLETLLSYGLIWLFYQTELFLYPLLYPAYSNEAIFSFLTNWRIVLPVLVTLPIVSLFMGTVYAKFGKTAGIIFYFVWISLCLIVPKIFSVTSHDTGLFNTIAFYIRSAFLAAPAAMLIGLGISILAAMAAAIWIWGRRQMVK